MIKLIVAIGKNNLIGKDDKMCWNIPGEFKHFKETTLNSSLLFGRKTFLGLPNKNLPQRKIYVFGQKKEQHGNEVWITSYGDLENLFDRFNDSNETLWIAGGKSIYENFYYLASELIVSEIKVESQGNVYLNWNLSDYKKTLLKTNHDFDVYLYNKEN